MNRPIPLPSTADLAQVTRGLLMGGADIIPGVSGGTVALILGIYERLVTAISHFDLELLGHLRRRQWVRAAAHVDLRFLVTLGCGILLGIGSLATLMHYLLEHQLEPTMAVFFGLILSSSVLVGRSIGSWGPLNVIAVFGGAGFAFWLVNQPFMAGREGYDYLFLCGMVGICAMILPGISGAFILLIMGKYDHVTGVIRSLVHGELVKDNILTLVVFAGGCCVGLLSFSKVLRWLLARYHSQTMAVLCGFMIGSLRRIWPFKEEILSGPLEAVDVKHKQFENVWPAALDGQVVLVVALAVAAMAFVLALDWLTRRYGDAQPR